MDPFTQRMLERAKSRREKLDNQILMLEQRSPLRENANNKLILEENSCVLENKKEKQYITPLRKSKLQKLAQFYSTQDENILLNDVENEEENTILGSDEKTKCRLGRLDELASKIKQWEDDVVKSSHISSEPQRNFKVVETVTSKATEETSKPILWDESMVEHLCSQGFSRTASQSRLIYEFENQKEKLENETNLSKDFLKKKIKVATPPKKNPIYKSNSPSEGRNHSEVLKKAALFESTKKVSPQKSVKDPAELSLAERKALFERNKGGAVLPKLPGFMEPKAEKKVTKTEEKIFELHKKQKQNQDASGLFQKETTVPDKILMEKKEVHLNSRSNLESKAFSGEEKRVAPQPPPFKQDEKIVSNSIEEETKIELASPRSGRLYPSLSNLDVNDESEANHSLTDSFNESKNSNLCLNMTLSDLLEMNKNNPTTPPSDRSFSQSKECQVLNKMDKLLEDALNDLSSESEGDSEDIIPSPPKMKKSSSFEYKSGHDNANSLLHTVSFYRKQQQISCREGKNTNDEEESMVEDTEKDEDESMLVQNKIQTLLSEVNKQQTIISQASQALNLCLSTVEFSGSGEQVEGERLLLLATHKRQACLNEVQRLKVENTLWPLNGNKYLTERGDVNLTNICLKLKRDALRSIAAAENLQYFVCLIKSDEQVVATPAVSATKENLKDMALQFPGQVKLENLLSNFKVTVEVYNLELSKELLPHDVKYHLLNKKEKKLLTPIKSKKSESKLVKPSIQSPAGPSAVRTSNFQMCGYIVFSLKEITRTQWILNKVPYVSPVEGTISMTIVSQLRLHDEFRGFLNMFDDISGFGAWHRRWCLLTSHFISYWKYPDDETKKVPMGTIDLRSVVTETVGLVSRDICARLNTFLLETTRPRLSDDQNSLVMSVKEDVTTIRHLLSADGKQEMTAWCTKLNKTLALLRSWKCNFNE